MSTFSWDTNNGITCNGTAIETNINLITKDQMQERFIADIIKDASIPTAPISKSTLETIFTNCFKDYTETKYKYVLPILERLVREKILKPNNEEILGNILKTSTVGSNIKISNAKNIFWESGFGAEAVCIDPNVVKIGTPAGILDSNAKGEPTKWFPDNQIKFDNSFCERLGFPKGMTWECSNNTNTGEYKVTINYGNNDILTGNISPTNRDTFIDYREGNEEKNKKIMDMNKIDCKKARRILITKELGDVAQIWLYLAYIYISGQQETRHESLMITTDSVVYSFCAILHLSCIYTGARGGVKSGCCTLKHFVAGEVDYAKKFHNMSTVYYSRLKSHNETILKGLETIRDTFKQEPGRSNISPFAYYRILQNGTLRLTTGDFQVDKVKDNKYNNIIKAFDEEIKNIKEQITILDDVYNHPEKYIDIFEYFLEDSIINRWYNEYCKAMDTYKCKQWITKNSVNNYRLHPGSLLDIIATNVGVEVPKTIEELENKQQTQSGGEFPFSREINEVQNKNQQFGYYECLFLCFLYETKFSKQINNDDDKIRFAMVYDHYVSLLKNDTNIDTILPGIIKFNNMKQENDILSKGNELAKYIYFAENWDYKFDKEKADKRILDINNYILEKKFENSKKKTDNDNKTIINPKRKIGDGDGNYSISKDDLGLHNLLKKPNMGVAYGGKKKHTKKKKRNTKRRRTIKKK